MAPEMPSIHVYRRKWRDKQKREIVAKTYSAQIRFSREGRAFLRDTGETNERKAREAARRIADKIAETELVARASDVLTVKRMFAKWVDEYGHRLRSADDIKWQIQKLADGVGLETEVETISNKTIHGFVQGQKAVGASVFVVNRCLETFRSILNYAALRWEAPVKVIAWKSFMQREPRERNVYLSPEEARALVAACPRHIGLAVLWSLYTGARLDETQTLTWERVDRRHGFVEVLTKAKGEEPVYRTIWLSDKSDSVLRSASCDETGHPKLVFEGQLVFDLTNRRRHWEAARKAIGRPELRFHDLRHVCASWLRQYARSDLKLIGRAVGHSNASTTSRYAHVHDLEVVEAFKRLPDLGLPGAMHETDGVRLSSEAINSAAQIENKLAEGAIDQ